MQVSFHVIEAHIRYLTTKEGGRNSGVGNGYRGQFFYDSEDFDSFQYFPEFDPEAIIPLGRHVRAYVKFLEIRWEESHKDRMYVGKKFEIHEGRRVVGEGTITRLEVPEPEWKGIVT